MKIERGYMVMKNGKAWGVLYQDGHSTAHGWIEPEDAPIHSRISRPESLTYGGGRDADELRTGKVVAVERRTELLIINE